MTSNSLSPSLFSPSSAHSWHSSRGHICQPLAVKSVHMTKFSPVGYKKKWQTHAPHMVLALNTGSQRRKWLKTDHGKLWITDGRATHQSKALITMWTRAQWPYMWERNKFLSCMRHCLDPLQQQLDQNNEYAIILEKKTHYRYIFKFFKHLYMVSNF